LLFALNDVFFLAIVPCIKVSSVLMYLHDASTYHMMLSLMKMFSLFKVYIQMPVLFSNNKSCFF
jgi:hypothetical protein